MLSRLSIITLNILIQKWKSGNSYRRAGAQTTIIKWSDIRSIDLPLPKQIFLNKQLDDVIVATNKNRKDERHNQGDANKVLSLFN